MPILTRHIAAIVALSLAGFGLGGCGTINEKLAAGVSDAIPAWAGGLPADAPPRPGTAKYDEFMQERERKRLMPASQRGEETKSDPSASGNDPLGPNCHESNCHPRADNRRLCASPWLYKRGSL